MRIDLHTHSAVSDGTDTPAELIEQAVRAELDVVALTDHDTAAGWTKAAEAAERVGMTLVPGMEISTKHRGHGVHLLAYLPDPDAPGLSAMLARIIGGRGDRVPQMVALLNELPGVTLALDDVVPPPAGPVGRPHVADALVRRGAVADRTEAFDRYLGFGRPAYVDRYAPALTEAVAVVVEAGGVPVVAHAWGRHGRNGLPEADLPALVAGGLAGLEVAHHDHDVEARRDLAALAGELDLIVTGSSDYHGTGKVDHDLGRETTDPAQYERLLATAAVNAARSGRTPPAMSGPRP